LKEENGMRKAVLCTFAMAFSSFCAFAVDGVVLINDSSVMAAGGYPYKITKPGSYRLSGNLTVPSGVNGIQILVSNVTLDLNGFTISGAVTNCAGPCFVTGVTVGAVVSGVVVRNGLITGFPGGLDFVFATKVLAEDLVVGPSGGNVQNTDNFGPQSIIRHVIMQSQAGTSIYCPSIVVESVSSGFLPNGTGCVFSNNVGFVF
jgi:hypothetical protein